MLWTLRKATVGGAPTSSGEKSVIQVILQDLEGVGYESHQFEVDTVNLSDPKTIINAVCTLFDLTHTPNNFGCIDTRATKKAVE